MRLRNQMTPGLKKCKDGYKSPMKKAIENMLEA